jgi:hypothetical protein
MISQFTIELKTGDDITDNELLRLRERILEDLLHLAEEFLADLAVSHSYNIPGPVDLPGRRRPATHDDGRLHRPPLGDSPGRTG